MPTAEDRVLRLAGVGRATALYSDNHKIQLDLREGHFAISPPIALVVCYLGWLVRSECWRLPNRANPSHPEPLPRVVSALGTLLAYVESADVAPTADMNTASEAWLEAAGETLARWQTFLENDLARANEQLQKTNQKTLDRSATADSETHSFE